MNDTTRSTTSKFVAPTRLIAKDLEERRGKLFDFSSRKLVASITPPIVTITKQQKPLHDDETNNGSKSVFRKNAGPEWFNMETPEVTPEIERDLRMIRLRGYMDPKQFFKKDDFASKKLPEHFQIGTVIAGMGEKSLKRKERPISITDEILQNDKVRKYARRVFDEVQKKSESGGKKSYRRKQNRLAGRFNKKRLF
jgi:hypothetical protein